MIAPDADTRIRGFLKTLMEKIDGETDPDTCTVYTVTDGTGEL